MVDAQGSRSQAAGQNLGVLDMGAPLRARGEHVLFPLLTSTAASGRPGSPSAPAPWSVARPSVTAQCPAAALFTSRVFVVSPSPRPFGRADPAPPAQSARPPRPPQASSLKEVPKLLVVFHSALGRGDELSRSAKCWPKAWMWPHVAFTGDPGIFSATGGPSSLPASAHTCLVACVHIVPSA